MKKGFALIIIGILVVAILVVGFLVSQFQTPSLITPVPIGQEICQSDRDCSSGEYCTQAGPIVKGLPEQKTCYKIGTVVPY